VDAAIRGLALRRTRRERRVAFVNAMALRGTVAVTLVAAVVALATLQPSGTTALQSPPSGQVALVAAAQQVVLNPRTNTLYVAHPDDGTVNALDASTQQDIATIIVGGRPSALALNELENRILVLDSSQKTLTEIDGSTNTVVSSTALDVAGTLTSIQVEPASGKIVVASVQAKTPSQAASSSNATGEVTVINGQSKKIESTTSVPVAPSSVMIIDPDSQQTLLVSEDVTTVLDDKWKVIDKLPGGIAAVFSTRGRAIAVLSAATNGAHLSIYGDGAATVVALPGRPVALVALPLGAYAALVDIGGGRSRITELAAGGVLGKSIDLDLQGHDLSYSPATKSYVVAGDRGIWSGSIANPVVRAPQIVTPSPSPSATPAPSVTPAPSASPVASQRPAAAVIEREPKVLEGASLVWPDVFRFELVDRGAPTVVGRGPGGRLWFVDFDNRLSALDATSGNVYTIYELPKDARIRSIEVGTKHVYAIDVAASRVYIVDLQSEKVTNIKLPFVKSSETVTVTPDDTLWFAVADQVLRLDVQTLKVEAANIGLYSVGAMTADAAGRVWFSNEAKQTVGVYDRPTHTVREFPLSRRGAVTSLIIDASGTLWIGTDASELFSMRDGVVLSTVQLGSPVLSLTTDGRGRAWFLATDAAGSRFGPVASPAAARLMPASVVGLWFDAKADAWLADRTSAGFFIALPEPRP
jgi:YVTN family beta-propeller protein